MCSSHTWVVETVCQKFIRSYVTISIFCPLKENTVYKLLSSAVCLIVAEYKLFSNIQISQDFSHLELKAVIVLSWSARYPHHVVFMFLQNTNTWIIKPSGSCRASPHSALVGNQCCISKHTESWEPPPLHTQISQGQFTHHVSLSVH